MLDLQLMVLYTKDRFSWDQHTLMEYNTYNFALMVVGQFICFPFLVKVLKLPLMLIGCLTCISRGGYYAMLASCNRLGKQINFSFCMLTLTCVCSSWCAHFSPLANILCGVQGIIYRSSLAKLLAPMELGSVFAMLETLITFLPFLISPVSTWLYNITLDTCPGKLLLN